MSIEAVVGQACSYIALTFGFFFFLYACKYYFAILIALFSGGRIGGKNNSGNGKNGNKRKDNWRNGVFELLGSWQDGNGNNYFFNGNRNRYGNREEPFVSIQLPLYNEKNVARRIIQACIDIDYTNYEIVVADDSRDETIDILKELSKRKGGPTIKYVHRKDRTGFKGGALQKAVEFMDPSTKYVVVFDADFIPPPDILGRFLRYFEGENGNGSHESENGHRFSEKIHNYYSNGSNSDDDLFERVDDWFERRRIGVVQGYQFHHLNKNENWITKGVRAEYSGGYIIERVAEEFFGALKMITGSVFMIRAEILRKLGWTHSITEDWDLTLRMYLEGYKVLYTPLIQAPAEIPKTIRALARQRMRWAEGHTFAVKKYFFDVLKSPNLTGWEKLEFIYFAPYYLQSFFFLIGTSFWMIAETLVQSPWFWTSVFGWCLIISNLFSLPLMSLSGLYLEQTAREDFSGIFSFVVLSYILTPFQAYAAVKGLLEKDEGGWVRTLKTGSITDRILQIRMRWLFRWILPVRERQGGDEREDERRRRRRPSAIALLFLIIMSSLIVWMTASATFITASGGESTSISFEYVESAIVVNTLETNRVLSRTDYTDLGNKLRTDAFPVSGGGWKKAWSFYLHGPLEQNYVMSGRPVYILNLRTDEKTEVDIKIKIREVDEDGKIMDMVADQFMGVELEDTPKGPKILKGGSVQSKKFLAGSLILVEIWLKHGCGDSEIYCYFEYDSETKPSRIEFPGLIMPESLLPLIAFTLIVSYVTFKKEGGEGEEN
ncbi:MAG: glycosyltransferase [Candidatus Bathyarchaeia archaeon]